MIKKFFIILLFIFNLAGIYYLLLPVPKIPDLPQSVKSDEPGDTVQVPNVSAYYTNLSRDEVINFYLQAYRSPPMIHIKDHPPEKARDLIRTTIQSYYLEELILPFKESLYINGFEWENDVFTKPEKRIKNKLYFRDIAYKSKITLRTFPTSPAKRLFVFFLTQAGIITSLYFVKKVYR